MQSMMKQAQKHKSKGRDTRAKQNWHFRLWPNAQDWHSSFDTVSKKELWDDQSAVVDQKIFETLSDMTIKRLTIA